MVVQVSAWCSPLTVGSIRCGSRNEKKCGNLQQPRMPLCYTSTVPVQVPQWVDLVESKLLPPDFPHLKKIGHVTSLSSVTFWFSTS